ncbi:MAG: YggS family pyridoxal phosphate-dependent enzyme [Planctomycetes bacterium]|nr:YggS family pyridoxal phosphate-dependent enzyme [Planctomycetota bacterium]
MSDALRKSLDKIRLRIKSAAERAGRNPDEIVVVAVTKTVGIETLKSLATLGWKDIGENRVTAAFDKAKGLPNTKFTWHMIGHLQGNKAKKAVGIFDYIHSLDSITLAEELQAEALKINKSVRVLIQVNVSGEATKGGIKPAESADFYQKVKEIISPTQNTGLIISGLMTMAPITDNPEAVRPYFRQLRELRDKLKSDFVDDAASEELKYLSMGMSQDFEVAIEEGANMLRIGTAIFG